MDLKKKVVELLIEELELIIEEDEWIEINENVFILDIGEATIHINEAEQDIGLSFNVNCEREGVYHLTKMLSTIDGIDSYLIESFIISEEGDFIAGEEAYLLKEEMRLKGGDEVEG